MIITKLILENFRNFRERTEITFDEELTVLIGRNDVGKSTILEALEIFFNNEAVKIEKADLSVNSEGKNVIIGVAFDEFPEKLVIDAKFETTLRDEYLLNTDGQLEIHKIFPMKSIRPKPDVYIFANHPTKKKLDDLLTLKIEDLKKRANQLKVPGDKYNASISSQIRKAIWQQYEDDLELGPKVIHINEMDKKEIWDQQLKKYLPSYAFFQSDRKNVDQDSEIQDPMKTAVKYILKQLEDDLNKIEKEVKTKVQQVADLTIDKLKEMNPEIANTLTPEFSKDPKWEQAFSFSMTSDEQIPLNKRGSGVRRLVLINFFRAEAERKKDEESSPNIIYAIEEPETSQHPDHQKKLIEAFIELAEKDDTQCILSTHSPGIANLMSINNLRLLEKNNGKTIIEKGHDGIYEKIAETLGVLPTSLDEVDRLKVIVCVEGPTDVLFLKNISSILGNNLEIDFDSEPGVILIPLGGCTLKQWVNYNYFKKLNKPEIHIYDSDNIKNPQYKKQAEEVNKRTNGSKAYLTRKKEIENYVHPKILETLFNLSGGDIIDFKKAGWLVKWNQLDVAKTIEIKIRKKGSKVKKKISEIGSKQMTIELLKEIDAYDEIKEWFLEIKNLM
jgi:predicted ATP-dependent endonuclease of OLD family